MPVNLPALKKLHAVPGFSWGVAEAGIRYKGRKDLAVLSCEEGTVAGGVYTQNRFKAAPVLVAEENTGSIRGVVVNSGNANAATGNQGLVDARTTCNLVAQHLACDANEILPFSTGVIGEFLPMNRFSKGIELAVENLKPGGWEQAAHAILTTDTQAKGYSHQFVINGKLVTTTGIVKGAGMIRPDMATMLAFQGTDACVSASVARQLVVDLSSRSFNRLTVDGDTSTNDAFVLMASNLASHKSIEDVRTQDYERLRDGLFVVTQKLAEFMVRDAEGATKFVNIKVTGGRTEEECLTVAFTIAHSPLVKTALFAGDPNWGRFCMAIGRAGIEDLDPNKVSLYLDSVQIAEDGLVARSYKEDEAAAVMAKDEFQVTADLKRGEATATVLTSDLSYDYVKINAEYRT